ncbi:MAG: hypothetical protein JRI23_23625, partial [Deltaproteobacteria bacterium]|nr:hypothetical protein [Deltaproteobacteria bacterium]MBW2534981.1 hypothetical protein [Deltaproteobacteria bacterium]
MVPSPSRPTAAIGRASWLTGLACALLVVALASTVDAAEEETAEPEAAAELHAAEALCLVDVAYGGHRWRERDLRTALERSLRSVWPGSLVQRRDFARAARRAGVNRNDWLSAGGLPRVAARMPLDLAVTAEVLGRGDRRRVILEALDAPTGEVRARVTQPMPRGKLSAGEAAAAIESLLTEI